MRAPGRFSARSDQEAATRLSLAGKRILITRAAAQARVMCAQVERRGGIPVVFPLIAVVPPSSWGPCDAAIARLDQYDAVVFTSGNAVEGFTQRTRGRGVSPEEVRKRRVYAVGETTAQAARKAGLSVEPVQGEASGASLAAALVASGVRGKRFLLPGGNLARKELPVALTGAGAVVDCVEVYRTFPPAAPAVDALRRRLLGGEIDVVTFASPSAVVNFGKLFPDLLASAPAGFAAIAAIGPTTAAALREKGVEPQVVASIASAAGLVEAIESFYQG